jgi:hypothetical protein
VKILDLFIENNFLLKLQFELSNLFYSINGVWFEWIKAVAVRK